MNRSSPGYGSTITLSQLGYAVALDTHRHFERAAASCNVTQPTLSMQLRKLEDALGETLFDRSRTPVIPTDIGAVVIAQARVVLREASSLAGLCQSGTTIAGELRVGVIPTLAPYLLPRVIEAVRSAYPLLQLIIEERMTESVLEGMRDETLDAGLVATSVGSPDFIQRHLFREPFVGYVSAGHRLSPREFLTADDLSLGDLWLLSDGHCLRTQVVTLCQQRGQKRDRKEKADADACTRVARFESGNLETLKRLVERGNGMTLLPALAAADLSTDDQRALVIPFTDPAPSRDVCMIRRRARFREHLVEALEGIIVNVALNVVPASHVYV